MDKKFSDLCGIGRAPPPAMISDASRRPTPAEDVADAVGRLNTALEAASKAGWSVEIMSDNYTSLPADLGLAIIERETKRSVTQITATITKTIWRRPPSAN